MTVQLSGVTKRFTNSDGSVSTAVDNVDLRIEPGDFVLLVGHNGSGKTTLQNLIVGQLLADEGQVLLTSDEGDVDWTRVPRWQRASRVAHVHQDPMADVVPEMTVLEHCRLAAMAGSGRRASPWRRSTLASDESELLDLLLDGAGLSDRKAIPVRDLSQGQRQLLVVALALLRRPALLLLDEHTANLDRRNAAHCMEVTETLVREMGTSVLMITHDLSAALNSGNRLVVMQDGRVAAELDADAKAELELEELLRLTGLVT